MILPYSIPVAGFGWIKDTWASFRKSYPMAFSRESNGIFPFFWEIAYAPGWPVFSSVCSQEERILLMWAMSLLSKEWEKGTEWFSLQSCSSDYPFNDDAWFMANIFQGRFFRRHGIFLPGGKKRNGTKNRWHRYLIPLFLCIFVPYDVYASDISPEENISFAFSRALVQMLERRWLSIFFFFSFCRAWIYSYMVFLLMHCLYRCNDKGTDLQRMEYGWSPIGQQAVHHDF